MSYEALIFDLDGTAITSLQDAMPSQRLTDAVHCAQDSGLYMCAATGRPITNSGNILSALDLIDPCIISGGTQIVEPQSYRIRWEFDIGSYDVQRVLDVCGPYPYELLVREELLGSGSPAAEKFIEGPVNIMYLMEVAGEDSEVILNELSRIPDISASGVPSWTGNDTDIHITHREATKEHAIAELLGMIGVDRENTIGVGDANNDVHLFRGVELKVAMGNGTKLLKSQADIVCDSVENDGLAKFIEELVRGEHG